MLPPFCRGPARIVGILGAVIACLAIGPLAVARVQTDLSIPARIGVKGFDGADRARQAARPVGVPPRPGKEAADVERRALTVLKLRFSF